MSDWGRFFFGLIDSFAADEYRKVIKLSSLESFLFQKWKLAPERLPYLLTDFGLSKGTVSSIDIKHLRPAEFGRRDSRLLRRPVVVLSQGSSTRCIYGLETIYWGSRMILERLEYGQIDIVRQGKNKELESAVGKLRRELGDIFERNIAEECRARGYRYQPEKDKIKGIKIPQGQNFGPVDVFVVDREHKRFVLVEAKNVMDEGMNPKEMAKEKREFTGFISKLNSQVEWFTQHLNELHAEYGVPAGETYSVEGVIVVNAPRVWMFSYDEPVPILDYINFFIRLARGSRFTINPVAPGPYHLF